MSGIESPDPLSGGGVPPPKRRRLHDESETSTPLPDVQRTRDDGPDTPDEPQLSVRLGRPRSSSRSRSRDGGKEKFYGGESDRSTERSRSRSRSRSRKRTRSFSGSQSRSRTRSRSESRSRSRASSRSRSGSHSRSHSRSQYHTPARDQTPTTNTLPAVAPTKPDYRPRLVLRGHTGPVSQVLISPNGSYIASSSADGTARIWDAATGDHLNTLVGHMAGVNCVAWSPDSMTLATGSDDKSIRLWDRITGGPAHDVPTAGRGPFDGEGTEGLNGRAASRRNRRAQQANAQNTAAAGQAGGDVDDRKPPIRGTKRALLGHSNYVTCLAFSPKGNLLASGSYDEAVFLWDVRAGVELGREAKDSSRLPAHSDPVSGVDFCADGTLVASCSTDGLIRIWDPLTRQCLRTLVHDDNPPVTSVCFSPNGRFVLAWSQDSCIRLWDYVAGSVKKTYQGHTNGNFTIGGCFGVLQRRVGNGLTNGGGLQVEQHGEQDRADPEEEYPFIASASEDGDVVLWDVRSKAVIQRMHGHEGVCFWVDVHGDTMVSGGQDGTIKIYRHRWPGAQGTQLDRRRNGDIAGNADQAPSNGVNGHKGMPEEATPELKADTPQQEQETRQVELSLRQEELKAEED